MSYPEASVIIPIRNEEKHIANCLTSLLSQTYPSGCYEIIVADGQSSDSTKSIVEVFCHKYPHLRLIDNPSGIVPCAMNLGIRNAKGQVIIRADGHTVYPRDYIQNCVKYLEQTGADNVGGPCLTVPANGRFGSRMVAAVLSSPFGVGDARFRTSTAEGYVDTVPFGAFRRELFDRIGLYNEKLVRNQDIELNARIRKAGGKIYLTPDLRTEYHPVAGYWELLRLTFRTSQWHLFSVNQNDSSLGVRHFAPAAFVAALAVLGAVSFLNRFVLFALVTLLLVYLFAGFWTAQQSKRKHGLAVCFTLPLACFCFHVSYGLGTLAGARYVFKAPASRPIRAGQPVV